MIPDLHDFQAFLSAYGYAAYIGVILISGLGVPLPEDIPLLVGGYLSARGDMDLVATAIIGLTAIFGADLIFFYWGRSVRNSGKDIPKYFAKILTPERKEKIDAYFARYGWRTAFFGRFLPGLRCPIFFCCGLAGFTLKQFLLSDGLAAILSIPALVYIGYAFANNLEAIQKVVGRVEYVIVAVIVVFAIATFLVNRFRKKQEAALLESARQNNKKAEP
jgi:membrane protein DedA with SNARE-associated domain